MNFKTSLDKYLTTPDEDDTDFLDFVSCEFTEKFFYENEDWIIDGDECLKLSTKLFYKGFNPTEAAKIIERYMSIKEAKVARIDKEQDEEDIWQQTQRFIDSIHDEIRSDDIDITAISFWLFKIERRVNIFKEIIDETTDNN